MNKLLKLAVAAASAAICFTAQAEAVLDDFSQAQTKIQTDVNNSGELWGTSAFSNSILGNYRDISVEKLTGANNNDVGTVSAVVAQGIYSFSTEADVYAVGKIVWDGINNAQFGVDKDTGLGNKNLVVVGNSFQLSVVSADLGFPFQIDVYTSSTQYSSFKTFALGPGTFQIPFVCFVVNVCPSAVLTTGAGGAADFTKVNAIVATVNVAGSTNSVDLRLDNVVTVPEPASLGLVGAAILGLGLARRRSSKAAK